MPNLKSPLYDDHFDRYIKAKAAVLSLLNLHFRCDNDPMHAMCVFSVHHHKTGVQVHFNLTHQMMYDLTLSELKEQIATLVEESIVLLHQEIEKMNWTKTIMVPVESKGYFTGNPAEEVALTAQTMQEAYKKILNSHKYYEPQPALWPSNYNDDGASQTLKTLGESFNLDQHVNCKICGKELYTVNTAVVHMNDRCKMTRNEIADYLESLDIDLKMKQTASTGGE